MQFFTCWSPIQLLNSYWVGQKVPSDFSIRLYVKCVKVLVTHLCPTICDPMNCSPPGSSVHGILQTRILEWVAILFSSGSF